MSPLTFWITQTKLKTETDTPGENEVMCSAVGMYAVDI